MSTRLMIAYALIALMIAALAAGAWLIATRDERRRRRQRDVKFRGRGARAGASPAPGGEP